MFRTQRSLNEREITRSKLSWCSCERKEEIKEKTGVEQTGLYDLSAVGGGRGTSQSSLPKPCLGQLDKYQAIG